MEGVSGGQGRYQADEKGTGNIDEKGLQGKAAAVAQGQQPDEIPANGADTAPQTNDQTFSHGKVSFA